MRFIFCSYSSHSARLDTSLPNEAFPVANSQAFLNLLTVATVVLDDQTDDFSNCLLPRRMLLFLILNILITYYIYISYSISSIIIYIYVYIYIYIYINVCIHTCISIYIYIYIHVHTSRHYATMSVYTFWVLFMLQPCQYTPREFY